MAVNVVIVLLNQARYVMMVLSREVLTEQSVIVIPRALAMVPSVVTAL